MIDVTIIIPTYNRLWSLPRAVECCRHTRCRTEIIVVDDGSTDGTWEWLCSQPDVVKLQQPHQGKPWAVNRAFAISQGRYIRFLDSDDFLAPGTIDLQFEAAERTQAGVVYGRVDNYFEKTKSSTPCPDVPVWDDFMAVMLGEGYGSHYLGMLFARSLVENAPHRPECTIYDDRMFLLEIALQKPSVVPVPGCVGYWVKHDRQIHNSYRGLQLISATWHYIEMYQSVLDRLKASGELTPRRARAAAGPLWAAIHNAARTHLDDAARLAHWLQSELCPDFVPPESRAVRFLYRTCGFKMTQRLFRLRRCLLGGGSAKA